MHELNVIPSSVAIFYLRALAMARRDHVRILRKRILAEATDKAYLIRLLKSTSDESETVRRPFSQPALSEEMMY